MRSRHLTDAELLLLADGELSGCRPHLDSCSYCQERLTALATSLEEITNEARRVDVRSSSKRLRERFQAPPAMTSCRLPWWFAGAAALLLFAALPWLTRDRMGPLVPRAEITPGAAAAITREQVCAAVEQDSEEAVPPVDPAVARRIFAHYGIRNPQPQAYELDYLITPALGGARDVRNLWPQPYGGGEWNARVKDALEDLLQREVCAGKLELETAQRELAGNWIAAYQRRFGTDRPLLAHLSYQKDRPWGE